MHEQSIPLQMVHEDNEVYSVTDMAELLFGNLSATSCYASHRLLSQERIFFKQVGRSPPRFQARSEKDVQSLKAKRQIDEKVFARCSSPDCSLYATCCIGCSAGLHCAEHAEPTLPLPCLSVLA